MGDPIVGYEDEDNSSDDEKRPSVPTRDDQSEGSDVKDQPDEGKDRGYYHCLADRYL